MFLRVLKPPPRTPQPPRHTDGSEMTKQHLQLKTNYSSEHRTHIQRIRHACKICEVNDRNWALKIWSMILEMAEGE